MSLLIASLLIACGEKDTPTDYSDLPPFSPIVELTPAAPNTVDDLEVLIVSPSVDPDSDAEPELTYLWYKNGDVQDSLTNSTLVSSELTLKGEIWSVSVIANDGVLDSAASRRSVTIQNSLPTVTAELSPAEPTLDDAVQVVATASDLDNDEIIYTYEWSLNGEPIDLVEDTLSSDQTDNGQEWMVTVSVNDGESNGESATFEFSFPNAEPIIDNVEITPAAASAGDVLTCTATASDVDGDELSYAYTWYTAVEYSTPADEAAGPVALTTGETLDTSDVAFALTNGTEVLCEAVVNDGLIDSAAMTATAMLEETAEPVVNLLTNAGFETLNGTVPSDWLIFPSNLTNYATESTGSGIFNSPTGATFTALEGNSALKLYGQFTGGENATPVYQELATSEGETHTFSVSAFSHVDDPLSGSNQLTVDLVYFDASYNFFGLTSSTVFDSSMADSTWHSLSVTATAPAGATIVQAVIRYTQCVGDATGACYDAGSIYVDDAQVIQ